MNISLRYQLVKSRLRFLEKIRPAEGAELGFQLFCTPAAWPIPAIQQRKELFDIADKTTVQVDANLVQVYRWKLKVNGPNRVRPQVFLLHGWGGSAGIFSRMVEQILFVGCDVVAFDFPAHGRSSGRQTTLSDCLRALQVVVHRFGPAYALVGHGYGGAVAALGTVQGSHLASVSGVKRLVLIGAPDKFSNVMDRFGGYFGIRNEALKRLKARAGVSLGGPVETFSSSSAIWASGLPVLVIHDKNDPEIPHDDGKAIASAIEQGIFISTEAPGRREMIQSGRVAHETARFIESGLSTVSGERKGTALYKDKHKKTALSF